MLGRLHHTLSCARGRMNASKVMHQARRENTNLLSISWSARRNLKSWPIQSHKAIFGRSLPRALVTCESWCRQISLQSLHCIYVHFGPDLTLYVFSIGVPSSSIWQPVIPTSGAKPNPTSREIVAALLKLTQRPKKSTAKTLNVATSIL